MRISLMIAALTASTSAGQLLVSDELGVRLPVPPMAAIANAIYNAVGVRMGKLPMSPGNILEALWDQK